MQVQVSVMQLQVPRPGVRYKYMYESCTDVHTYVEVLYVNSLLRVTRRNFVLNVYILTSMADSEKANDLPCM